MGQTLEKEKPTKKKQRSTLSTLFGASFCSDKRDGFGCFESDSTRVNKLKSSWKKHVLRQLSELGTQEWVQLLIKCLREHNTEESDIIFQNELLRSDFYCVNDTLHYTSESPLYSRTEYPNDSNLENPDSHRDSSRRPLGNKRATIFNIQGNRKDSQSVKNLLESSDIIDEKFFHLNGKDDWLDRSFEITSKDDLHTGPQSGNIMTNQRIINKNADQFKALDEQNINPPPVKKGKKTHIKHAFSNPSSPNLGPKKGDHHHSDDEGGEIDGKVVSHMTLKNRKAKEMGISPLSLPKSAVDSNKNQDSPKEGNPYKTLLPYKIITNLLTQHLRTEHHILCMMIQTFEEYFGRTYREIPNDVKNEKILLGQVKDFALKATSELKQFIEIMHQAISLFYRLDQLKIGQKLGQEALFTSDNMFNFVSSNVFDGEIHDIIFNLYQKLNLSVEGTYESSLNRYKSPNPKDFGVDDDFCLNERTVQLLRDKNLLPTHARERDELFQTLYFDIASPKNREERSQELKEQDQTKNPYSKAILTLQALSEKKSPIHKLKVIVKMVENISACIEHFYKDLGVSEIKKIDSEQTLAIFMYITAQSGVQDITTHCRIIENFSTRNLLESLSGYYATLLEDAVNKICGMDVESQCSEANSQISEVHNTFT